MKHVKLFCLCAFVALTGCKGYIAGYSSDMSQLVIGDGNVYPGKGLMTFNAKFPGNGRFPGLPFTCSGKVEVTERKHGFGGIGTKFRGPFTCTDGRKGTAEMTAVEVGESKGTGTDECGNVFHVYAAVDEDTIDELAEEYRAKIKASGREFVDKCEAQGGNPEHYDPII